jgi:hypothetical protein
MEALLVYLAPRRVHSRNLAELLGERPRRNLCPTCVWRWLT